MAVSALTLLVVALWPACGGDDGPRFGNVVFSTSIDEATGAPVERTDEFAPEVASIYASVPVERLNAGETVTFRWYHLGEEVLVGEFTLPEDFDEGWVWGSLEPSEPLPAGGDYRVELHHRGALVAEAPFGVAQAIAVTPTP